MIRRISSNQKLLAFVAIIVSLILGTELIFNGYAYLNSTLNSKVNYPYFDSRYIARGIEYLILTIIYLVWLIQNRQRKQFSSFLAFLKITWIFLLIAFVAYPASTDIYLYLHYGLMDLNGLNPFINPAGAFKSQLSPLLVWSQTSTYGPISQLIFLISAYFTSVSIVFGVYIFKLFCVLTHVVNGYIIWRQLKSSSYQTKITLGYILNPLILFEQVANAHIDVFVCTTLIGLIACFNGYRYIAGVLVTLIGFLTKTVPIVWIPLLLIFLIKQKRWRSLTISTILSLTIIVSLSLTIFPTGKAWLSILNSGVVWQTAGSLHNILSFIIQNIEPFFSNSITHPHRLQNVITIGFRMLTYLIFVVYYVWMLFKIYFRREPPSITNLILDIGWTTLVLFLFTTPWYQPWYCSILLPIVALYVDSWFFVFTSLTFCISSSISYYLLAYPNAPGEFFVLVSTITVLPPILVLLFRKKLLQLIAHPWSVRDT